MTAIHWPFAILNKGYVSVLSHMEHMDIYSSNVWTFKTEGKKASISLGESPRLKEGTSAENNQIECRERSRTGLQQLTGLCDNLRGSLYLTSDGTQRELAELDGIRYKGRNWSCWLPACSTAEQQQKQAASSRFPRMERGRFEDICLNRLPPHSLRLSYMLSPKNIMHHDQEDFISRL